mmetsp:Transcript_111195/g.313805  ORF Transcript_111195/g.313805 Transcript_111195/m.313805 type:complete len:836 (-) Transcript_111195:178-2685(-)
MADTTIERITHSLIKYFDRDDSGTVSMHEFKTALQELDDQWTDADCANLVRAIDTNSDGVIQREEYLDWVFGRSALKEGMDEAYVKKLLDDFLVSVGLDELMVPSLRLRMKEPESLRYLYVDPSNTVILMMPLTGGQEIGTDNTCKSVVEVQKFFGKHAQAAETKDSACHYLRCYLQGLEFDLEFFTTLGIDDHPAITKKRERKGQIEAYIQMLETWANIPDVNQALQGSYPKYPQRIGELIKQADNLQGMLLCPASVDTYVRQPSYTFHLKRAGEAVFQKKLVARLNERGPLPDPLPGFVFQGMGGNDTPDEAKWTLMQQRLVAYFEQHGEPAPTFQYTSLEMFYGILMVECDTMSELLEMYLSAEAFSMPTSQSTFVGEGNLELLSIMTQMFLAMVGLHAHSYCGAAGARNLGQILDSSDAYASEVCDALHGGNPEDAMLTLAQRWMEIELPGNVQQLVKDRFRASWMTVKGSPHYDEFLLHFQDVYTGQDSLGVVHQGCIAVPFGALGNTPVCTNALQAFHQLKPQLAARHESMPHSNAAVIRGDTFEVDKTLMVGLANELPANKVAELLTLELVDGTPLYTRFMRKGQKILPNWPLIKEQMTAMMPDQDALDRFGELLANYEMGVPKVPLRVTTFMARSIYTQATATVSGAAERLSQLDNISSPDKLTYAMQCLEIDITPDDIHMSPFHNGYTINVSKADKVRLKIMHQEQRQKFHITQDMAKFVYMAVTRRYGQGSQAVEQLGLLGNRTLDALPDPRPGRPRGSKINAPAKMFMALRLLDIIIPGWAFNGYSGYIVHGSADAIDALEQVVEEERRMQDPEAAAPMRRRGR